MPASVTAAAASGLTPGAVVGAAGTDEWRALDPENTLYIELASGTVVAEMRPELAPLHVANTRQLVRQGVFDGSQFYRVIDAFVAQGGPLFADEAEQPELAAGAWGVPAEFTSKQALPAAYLPFNGADGYADETGFLHSQAVGRDLDSGESWLLHCHGALAMGRSNDLNSGATALYVVNGPAQRYLDRNTTVFGRVIAGMEHIQALQRSASLQGPNELNGVNEIIRIRLAADMPAAEQMPLVVLDSASASFKQMLAARQNRTGDWFVYQHDHIDTCAVPIPVKLLSSDDQGKN
jgi:peptidylprolyl isomerase